MWVFAIGIKRPLVMAMKRLHHFHLREDHRPAVPLPPASPNEQPSAPSPFCALTSESLSPATPWPRRGSSAFGRRAIRSTLQNAGTRTHATGVLLSSNVILFN